MIIYGWHSVKAAIENPTRKLNRLLATENAARRLAEDPLTLEELSAEFGVSRERIRQIEVRAFEKVQKAVQKAAAAETSEAAAVS